MQKTKFLSWAGSLSLCVMLAGLAGCQQEQETEPQPLLKVKTVSVQQSEQSNQWFLTGTLQAKTTIDLAFRVAGEVESIKTDLGERVEPGQELIHLDPADYQLAVTSAQANIKATEAEISQTQSDLRRISTLQQRKLASEQAQQQLENQLKALQAKQKASQQQLQQAKNQLNYTQIQAPVAGIISARLAEKNQVITVGQPVLQLIADGEREVVVEVPESRLQSLPDQGQAVIKGKTYAVTLRATQPQADSASRTWSAYYRLPDIQTVNAMQLGQSARLQFSQAEKGIQLPLSALYEQGDYSSVWILHAGKAKRVPVKVVRIDRNSAWVKGDFSENAKVIALGVHLLTEGQALEEMP